MNQKAFLLQSTTSIRTAAVLIKFSDCTETGDSVDADDIKQSAEIWLFIWVGYCALLPLEDLHHCLLRLSIAYETNRVAFIITSFILCTNSNLMAIDSVRTWPNASFTHVSGFTSIISFTQCQFSAHFTLHVTCLICKLLHFFCFPLH